MSIGPIWLGRMALRVGALAATVWLAHWLIGWTMSESAELEAGSAPALGVLLFLLVAYAVLIALPFVPGVELGIALMMVEGAWIAPFIWAATVLGLSLAFLAGAALPYPALRRLLTDLRLPRAAAMVAAIEPMDLEARLAYLRSRMPGWLAPVIGGQRYVLLALLINLPGNSILGGGGGILLLAGFSRLFGPAGTLVTVALAVAPVPILVYLLGAGLPLPGF